MAETVKRSEFAKIVGSTPDMISNRSVRGELPWEDPRGSESEGRHRRFTGEHVFAWSLTASLAEFVGWRDAAEAVRHSGAVRAWLDAMPDDEEAPPPELYLNVAVERVLIEGSDREEEIHFAIGSLDEILKRAERIAAARFRTRGERGSRRASAGLDAMQQRSLRLAWVNARLKALAAGYELRRDGLHPSPIPDLVEERLRVLVQKVEADA